MVENEESGQVWHGVCGRQAWLRANEEGQFKGVGLRQEQLRNFVPGYKDDRNGNRQGQTMAQSKEEFREDMEAEAGVLVGKQGDNGTTEAAAGFPLSPSGPDHRTGGW